jgi:glycosyltransferase involved in cell wall biosynthesis
MRGNGVKVCFIIWALTAAGAERVLSFLANGWAQKGWDVVILTTDSDQAIPFYPLMDSIELRQLNLLKESHSFFSALNNNIIRVRTLRSAIKEVRPDVLISFLDTTNSLTIMATRGLGIPVIISERTDPSRRSLGPVWGAIRDFTYPLAELVVFQSQAVLDWFPSRVRARGIVIPNPVPPPPPPPPSMDPPTSGSVLRIVSMGRLAPVKGFDVLIKAFKMASDRVPHWHLVIWGEGPDRHSLERMVDKLGMAEQISFPGITDRPYDILRNADIFVLSSHAEGFPNALAEAMACGLPVISTRFGGAVDDIITNGVDGIVVPPGNPEELADSMVHMMANPTERARLGEQALRIVERFSMERVLGMWEEAVEKVTVSYRDYFPPRK